MPQDAAAAEVLHASCVALAGRALLITGRSGSGKSGLSLELMARGARLVADDRVQLRRDGAAVIASVPAAIAGMIEARGLGLLHADPAGPTPVFACLDLDRQEPERLPQLRHTVLLGVPVTLLLRPDTPHLAAGLIQFLASGRRTL
ncbi:HPr kinase/phosphorylase [Pseudodonghicola flavimaris]|uniref:Serine kinase n=1 Tax=Pseudodonghicola flavimaris TaxID=3050036 RepID=A0ABT7F6I9_9RHOB|nr:serine kinase [Pseudodonghicola flavimaris]MDK3020214.1 serine kinase [Pseudodonghicola flavimaris]